MENIQVCVLGSAILIFLVIYVCIFSGLFTIESFNQYPDANCSEFNGYSNACDHQNHCEWGGSAEKCIPIQSGCAAKSESECTTDSDCLWNGSESECFSPVDPLSNTPNDVADACSNYERKDMCKFARDKWNRPCRWLKPWDNPVPGAERECLPDWTDTSDFPVSDCNISDSNLSQNDEVHDSCGKDKYDEPREKEDCNKAMWYKSHKNPAHGNCEWKSNKCKRRTHTNQRFNCKFKNQAPPSQEEGGGGD